MLWMFVVCMNCCLDWCLTDILELLGLLLQLWVCSCWVFVGVFVLCVFGWFGCWFSLFVFVIYWL